MRDQRPHFSTSIELAGNKIYYRIEDQWVTFSVDQIQLIGEFSAPPGLLAADYFFSFKLRDREVIIDIPGYTDGLLPMLSALKRLLPGIGNPVLQMDVEFNSNVLYPAHVAGQALFNFKQADSPVIDLPILRNFGRKQTISKEVREEVLLAVY